MSGLVRYAPRHGLDMLMTRGVAMLGVALVVELPLILSGAFAEATTAQLTDLMGQLLGTLGVFFTLIAAYGLIGDDVRHGYYRFLFAKPVSPVAYYATSFVMTTLVFLAGVLGSVAVFSVLTRPVWPGSMMLEVLVDFCVLAALIMVYSRFSRFDWLLALVTLGLSDVARHKWPREQNLFGKVIDVLVPPTRTGRLFPADGPHWDMVAHELLYAGALLLLALWLVRRVPFGSAR